MRRHAAAIYRPLQNAAPFSAELFGKTGIAFRRRDGDRERYEVDAAADRLVNAGQRRFVVAGDHQLELRAEGEEVLVHEARCDGVAAGERLDLGLGPAPAAFGLLRNHEPRR
jgi:hypothetical protein